MRPMSTFDPTKPALVHDRLNDRTFAWVPAEHLSNWQEFPPHWNADGTVEWDGLILDGWAPV